MADEEHVIVSVGTQVYHIALERARLSCPEELQRYEEVRQRAYQTWQAGRIDVATARELEASRQALLSALAEVLRREPPG